MTAAIIPIPRIPITTRLATAGDLPFVDGLQKVHTKAVGWMPTTQLETKIASGSVLVAVGATPASPGSSDARGGLFDVAASGDAGVAPTGRNQTDDVSRVGRPGDAGVAPTGYVIATDRYMKREDCGIIYQMNVVPDRQRSLVAATLLKAVFERAAYGCRLFCCWCAQDLAANHFWQAMGFVPLAFRSGSRDKGRTHIFWQRRVRAGDETTPYWFPSQTGGGSIREDRLVLPIPPGLEWNDEMPVVLPVEPAKLEARNQKQAQNPKSRLKNPAPTMDIRAGGLRLATLNPAAAAEPAAKPKREEKPASPEQRRRAVKNDPRLVAAARELRDRWLERVNGEGLGSPVRGKYDVSSTSLRPDSGRVLTERPAAAGAQSRRPIRMTDAVRLATPALPAPAAA